MIISKSGDLNYKFELLQDINFSMKILTTDIINIRLIAVKKQKGFLQDWNDLYMYLCNGGNLVDDKYINIFTCEYNFNDIILKQELTSIFKNTEIYIMYLKARMLSNKQLFISHPYIELNQTYFNKLLIDKSCINMVNLVSSTHQYRYY
jgi:hypothetical protein